MVSNSLASWANSSSASGSSRSLTEPTVTVTSASSPACVAGHQRGGEGLGLAGLQPDERLVETVDQLAGADLVGQALGLGLGHVLAVDGGRQVDGHEVAVLHRPLDTGQGAEAGPQRLQLVVDVLVADLDRVDRDLQGTQVGQRDLRADVDLGGEHQLLAVLDLGDLDLGLTERLHLGGGHGLAVTGRQRVVDDLLEHRAATDAGLEQLGGRLARAEAGQPDLLGELLVGAVEVGLQLVEGHLYIDANPGRAQLLDGALHGYSLIVFGRSWSCRVVLVGVTGFEPAAFRSQSGCATKLRYTPMLVRCGRAHGILRPAGRT